jgi:uracil-DNA glycosylase
VNKLRLLDAVEAQWNGCTRCVLSRSRSHVVHWRGSPVAPLFVIGDAPSADEDAEGLPFVDASGRLLDLLLKEAGLSNNDVFMTNMVACSPHGRGPEPEEVRSCSERLQASLRIVRPGAILLLGHGPARLAGLRTVVASRGQVTSVDLPCYDGKIRSWPAVVTWSPSFLRRAGGQGSKPFQESLADVMLAWKLAK